MLRAAVYEVGAGQPQRFLLVIHHLLVDGISWRILIEDLQRMCEDLHLGKSIDRFRLPAKTSSFKQWAERLAGHVRNIQFRRKPVTGSQCSRRARPHSSRESLRINTVASARTLTSIFDETETKLLLQEVPSVYHTHINDVLLASCFRRGLGGEAKTGLQSTSKGMGATTDFEDLDMTRTVGWFTSLYPVVIEPKNVRCDISTVCAELKSCCVRSREWAQLRTAALLSSRRRGGASGPSSTSDISFNYLGQLDQTLAMNARSSRCWEARE